jgi:hypothetical protein
MTPFVLLAVSAAEQFNATTQQMLQKQPAQQQQDGSSKCKGQAQKHQQPFPDCESHYDGILPPYCCIEATCIPCAAGC